MNQHDHIEDLLLLDYLLGRLEASQRMRVDKWLSEKEANRNRLDCLESLWLELGKLDPPPLAVDTKAAWLRVSARIDAVDEAARGKAPVLRLIRAPILRWAAGIAAMALLAVGAWWLADSLDPGKQMRVVASMEEVVRDTLSDGSLITLNRNSSLAFTQRFPDEEREVALLGEAFFEVEPDSTKPFVVLTSRASVKVLGTSFNVRAYPGETVEVSVLEGKVLFSSLDTDPGDPASLILVKGMKGLLKQGSNLPVTDTGNVPDELFWLNQTLQFRETPLSDVIRLLTERYGIAILLSDSSIGNCRLTATFTGESIDLILRVIADTFALKLDLDNGTFLLTGNGCTDHNR